MSLVIENLRRLRLFTRRCMAEHIILFRHGRTVWNNTNRLQGISDQPLSEEGIKEVKDSLWILENFNITKIFSSPLKRAVESAQIIADHFGMRFYVKDELKEFNFGEWEGKPAHELWALSEFKKWFDDPCSLRPPKGDDFTSFKKRVVEAIDSITSDGVSGDILIVTHAGVISAYLSWTFGISKNLWHIMIDNASVTVLTRQYPKRLVVLNFHSRIFRKKEALL